MPARRLALLSHPTSAALAVLLLMAGGASGTTEDRYIEGGPLARKPNLVQSVEGFIVGATIANLGIGSYVGRHTDYPSENIQQVTAPRDCGSDCPDETLGVVERLQNADFQLGGGVGDFDGDGVSGKVIAWETNYRIPGVATLTNEKALRIVIQEGGTALDVTVPPFPIANGHQLIGLKTNLAPDTLGHTHFELGLRVAVGQLDDDPQDEAVIAWWTFDDTIALAVVELVDSDDDGIGDTPQITMLPTQYQPPLLESAMTIARAGSTSNGRSSVSFAVAVGDFDGDVVDEIALVFPGPHMNTIDIDGLATAEVRIYEYDVAGVASVFVQDSLAPLFGFDALIGDASSGIIPSGGGTFKIPRPGDTGSLVPAGTNSAGTAVRLKRMIAEAAHLPYVPDPDIDRLGAPRESLVVGLQMHQENLNQKWVAPGGFVWLRPSRFDADCQAGGVPTNGETTYCLTNDEPVLNHATGNAASYDDPGTTRPSHFCMAAANIREDDAEDEIVMMFDPHLFVLRGVLGGDAAKSSQDDPASLVNADPDTMGTCPGGMGSEATAGQCVKVSPGISARNSNGPGQHCAITVADLNGHQTLADQGQGDMLEAEILVSVQETSFLSFTQGVLYEVDPDTLTLNPNHQYTYYSNSGLNSMRPVLALFPDVDGDGVFLSDPFDRLTVRLDQPLVMVSSPPIHFDDLSGRANVVGGEMGGDILDPQDCFEPFVTLNRTECPFKASYSQLNAMAKALSHTYNSDWQISNTTSGCTGPGCGPLGIGPKIEVSMMAAYGMEFESTSTASQTEVDQKTVRTTEGKDQALFQTTSYDIWEYEVLCNGLVDGMECGSSNGMDLPTVSVVTPNPTSANFLPWPRPDVETETYLYTHEGGNLLSYKSSAQMSAFLAGATLLTSDSGFGVTTSSEVIEDVTLTETTTESETEGSIFSFMSSVSGSGSFGVVDISTTFSGGFSMRNFVSKKAAVSLTQTLDFELGQQQDSANNYTVTPYVYLRDGAFVLDYAMDLITCGPPNILPQDIPLCVQNQLPNSVFANYIDDPDPAFRLPNRLEVAKGLTTEDPADMAHRTTEILIQTIPSPGDPRPPIEPLSTVNLTTRVHNYSFVDLNDETTVSFYEGDPRAGGTLIGSSSIESIPARGTVEIPSPVPYSIPQMTDAQFNATQVFAKLTLPGGVGDIHTDNNIAWRALSPSFLPEPTSGLLGAAALGAMALLARARQSSRSRSAGAERHLH
jgi:hypothetical protein